MNSNKVEKMLCRLEEISQSFQKTGYAKALIGFGSVAEIERLDSYSDLDFIAIVKKGKKSGLINNPQWLTSVFPVDYFHQSTEDSFKLLYSDGIYCDFGILEEDQLSQIPHDMGRIIWSEDDFDRSLCLPTHNNRNKEIDVNREIGEALFDLYKGLCRYARGEKLSAYRCIQNNAVDRVLSCSSIITEENNYFSDSFQYERRYEKRYPHLSEFLPKMIQGYQKSPESALAILTFVDTYFEINQAMKETFIKLCHDLIKKMSK